MESTPGRCAAALGEVLAATPVVDGPGAEEVRRAAMTPADLAAFLAAAPLAVVSTTREDGSPHATPVPFDVLDGNLLVNNALGTARLRNLERDGRAVLTVLDAPTGAGAVHRTAILQCSARRLGDAAGVRAGLVAAGLQPSEAVFSWPGVVFELRPVRVHTHASRNLAGFQGTSS